MAGARLSGWWLMALEVSARPFQGLLRELMVGLRLGRVGVGTSVLMDSAPPLWGVWRGPSVGTCLRIVRQLLKLHLQLLVQSMTVHGSPRVMNYNRWISQ